MDSLKYRAGADGTPVSLTKSLLRYNGDCWGSYWKYSDCLHAICRAHLLRELNGIEENHPEQTWVKEFKNLLLEMKKVKDKAVAQEKEAVSYYYLHKFDKRYDEIIQQAYEESITGIHKLFYLT